MRRRSAWHASIEANRRQVSPPPSSSPESGAGSKKNSPAGGASVEPQPHASSPPPGHQEAQPEAVTMAATPKQIGRAGAGRAGLSLLASRGSEASPLAEDIPPDVLMQDRKNRGAKKKADNPRRGNTTESQYASGWRKWWSGFCSWAKRPEWNPEGTHIPDGITPQFRDWLDPNPPHECVVDGRFRQVPRRCHPPWDRLGVGWVGG